MVGVQLFGSFKKNHDSWKCFGPPKNHRRQVVTLMKMFFSGEEFNNVPEKRKGWKSVCYWAERRFPGRGEQNVKKVN